MENRASGNFVFPDCTVWHFNKQPRKINGLCFIVRAMVQLGCNIQKTYFVTATVHFHSISPSAFWILYTYICFSLGLALHQFFSLSILHAILSISGVRVHVHYGFSTFSLVQTIIIFSMIQMQEKTTPTTAFTYKIILYIKVWIANHSPFRVESFNFDVPQRNTNINENGARTTKKKKLGHFVANAFNAEAHWNLT